MAGASLARYFRFAERSTDLATEMRAGVTTFMVMAYIIFVNPVVLGYVGKVAMSLILHRNGHDPGRAAARLPGGNSASDRTATLFHAAP